jgi:hypothetical protein
MATILPLAILSNTAPIPHGLQPEYELSRMQMVERLPLYSSQLNQALIIAPHGDQFVVTSVLGIRSQQRPVSAPHGQTIYWLLRRMRCDASSPQAMVLATEEIGLCAVLVEDGEFRKLSRTMTALDWRRLLAANPHIRDAHLAD